MKYLIDIEEVPFTSKQSHTGETEKLYRAKGFNSLVFDEEGLKKLEIYHEIDPEFHVGDEVCYKDDARHRLVITHIDRDSGNISGIALTKVAGYCDKGTVYCDRSKLYWKKTGKVYPEIVNLLS